MRNFAIFTLGIAFLTLTSCAQFSSKSHREIASLETPTYLEGLWFLQGTHNVRGPYNGELELRRAQDGTYDVVRLITYINYYFEGFKVQEIWTGKAVADSQSLTVSYTLKQADFITRLGVMKRTPADFKTPLHILAYFTDAKNGLTAQFNAQDSSVYSEWLTTRRDLEPAPLWLDQRTRLEARSTTSLPPAVRNAIRASKQRLSYGKNSLIKSYSQRKEYKEEIPYVVFDPTDYDFYQRNTDILRVTNKVTDAISLAEVLVRRNAYAPTLEEKARGFEKHRQNALTSPIETGLYVGTAAMRYLTTQEKEALENIRWALKALLSLPEPSSDAKREWALGLSHAFLWASLALPKSDSELWTQLQEKSLRLPELNAFSGSPSARTLALGIAALLNNDSGLKQKYLDAHKTSSAKKMNSQFAGDFYWQGNADWNAQFLGTIESISQIMLAEQLGVTELRDQLRGRMIETWLIYRPARRHFQTLATYAFAYRFGARGDSFRKLSNEDEFTKAVEHSFWGLREIPYPTPTSLSAEVDHSLNPEWCASPIPINFWLPVKSPKPPIENFYQGLYNYPIFEQEAFNNGLIWRSDAFKFQASQPSSAENSGVDYLYAYWLSRYSELLPAKNGLAN